MASRLGGAGSRRKQSIEHIRHRVQQKLDSIHEQKEAIMAAVHSLVDNVNSITSKAEDTAQVLLLERDRGKVMHHLTIVMTQLEEAVNRLVLIQYSLQGEELDTETSDAESSGRDKLDAMGSGRDKLDAMGSGRDKLDAMGSGRDKLDAMGSSPIHSRKQLSPVAGIHQLASCAKKRSSPNAESNPFTKQDFTRPAVLPLKHTALDSHCYDTSEVYSDIGTAIPNMNTSQDDEFELGASAIDNLVVPQSEDHQPQRRHTEKENVVHKSKQDNANCDRTPNVCAEQVPTHKPGHSPLTSGLDEKRQGAQQESAKSMSASPMDKDFIPATEPYSAAMSGKDFIPADLPSSAATRREPELQTNLSKSDQNRTCYMPSFTEDVNVACEGGAAGSTASGGSSQQQKTVCSNKAVTSPHHTQDHVSVSSNDASRSTSSNVSRRKKKNLRKNKKVAELLKGIDKYLSEGPEVEAELQCHVAYGLGPKIECQEIIEGDLLEVFITEIIDPSFFWIQPQSPSYDDLADSLSAHYRNLDPQSWEQTLTIEPCPGMIVCGRFTKDDSWYRARILAVYRTINSGHSQKDVIFIDVLYIDFGNREKLPMHRVRPLHPKFSKLPCQAFPCALAQAGSPDGSDIWPEYIRTQFAGFVTRDDLTFHAVLTLVDACPLYLAELYFPLKSLCLGPRPGPLPMSGIMHSVVDMMTKEQRARRVQNAIIVQSYKSRMASLTRVVKPKELVGRIEEADVHHAQSPRQVTRCSSSSPKQTVLGTESKSECAVSGVTPGSVDTDHNPRSKQSSLDSDEWKSQVVDENFDDFLDAQIQRSSDKDEHSQDRLSTANSRPSRSSDEDIRAYKAPEPETPALENVKKTLEYSPENTELAPPKTLKINSDQPRETAGMEQSSKLKVHETDSKKHEHSISQGKDTASVDQTDSNNAANDKKQIETPGEDVAPVDPTGIKDSAEPSRHSQSQSDTSSSKQQRLLELGFPEKLPKDCEFSKEYQQWMSGDTDSLEVAASKSQTVAPQASVPAASSGQSEKSPIVQASSMQPDCQLAEVPRSDNGKVGDLDPLTEGTMPSSTSSDSLRREADNNTDSNELRQYATQQIIVPEDCCVSFLMAHIESPSKFWIHVVTQEAINALDNLIAELTHFYAKDSNIMIKKYFDNRVLQLNLLCCAQFEEDKSFYRGKIVGLCHTVRETVTPDKKRAKLYKEPGSEKKIDQVQVFYVDYGNTEWVPTSKVYPLPPKFTDIAPQAICCQLQGVEPIVADYPDNVDGGNSTDKGNWSLKACKHWEKLTGFKKQLVGYVVDTKEGHILSPDEENPLPLVVVDTSGVENLWLGEELVRQGLAKCTKAHAAPSATGPVGSEVNTTVPCFAGDDGALAMASVQWNPMADDYLSERNSYQIDINDPAVATLGYKPQDEKRVCKYFNMRGGCWRQHCTFEHISTKGQITTDKKPVFCAYDPDHLIAPPIAGSWVILEVATVISPGHFYAIFPFGTKPVLTIIRMETNADGYDEGYSGSQSSALESIDALMDCMSDHYCHIPHRDTDFTAYAEGEIVACLFTQDNRWYRARIIDSDPDDSRVQVFYVDFGNREWVSESRIRQMEPQFMQLRFQALECFVPIDPVNGEAGWSKEAREYFFNLVDGKVLFAHILESDFNGVLNLHLYDTTDGEVKVAQAMADNGFARTPVEQTHLSCKVLKKRRVRQRRRSGDSSGSSTAPAQPRFLPG